MVDNQKRWWDPIVGISLFLLVFFTAYSLELTCWTFDLNRITSIALLGTIFGILIGQSAFNRTLSFLLSSLYGVEIFLWQFIFSLSDETAWLARFELVVKRFQTAVSQFLRKVPLDDGILFLAIMAAVFTVLSIAIGYLFTRKGKPYIPLSIMTIIFIAIQFFVPAGKRNSLIFMLYSMLLVLFLGRMHYLTNRMKWETLEFQKDKSTAGYLLRAILVLSLVFSTLVWGIQFLAEKLSYFNNQADFHSRRNYSNSNERISNILYPLRSLKVQFGDGMFAETISLGTSRSLDDSLVFKVEPPEENNHLGRYYWKARMFSQYEDGHWRNDDLEFAQFDSVDNKVYLELSENLLPYTFTYEVKKKNWLHRR